MKKAQARSTICIERALATGVVLMLATTAVAQAPQQGCFVRSYDAAHLQAHPEQGVAALRLWFYSETTDRPSPAAIIEARMADQGQGARDGVGGQTLTQDALCEASGDCFVECDGGHFEAQSLADGRVQIETSSFAIGDADSCGGSSDLAEQSGTPTTYVLNPAPTAACETLAQFHPLPGPGCYGIDYSDRGHGQGLLALRLLLRAPQPGFTYPVAEGSIAVRLPDAARARAAGLAGVRVSLPVVCSARDGACRSSPGDGSLAVVPMGQGLALSTARFLVYGPDSETFDIADPTRERTRHQLRLMPDDACRGME